MKANGRAKKRWLLPLLMALLLLPLVKTCVDNNQSPQVVQERPPVPTYAQRRQVAAGQALQSDVQGLDLVFEGGGAKGLAHAGAIRELEQRGLRYRRIAGTSAGALVAMFVAAGFTGDEVRAAITQRMPDGTIVMGSFLVVPEQFEVDVVQNSLAYQALQDLNLPESMNSHTLDVLLQLRAFREAFSLVEFGGLVAGDDYLHWLKANLNSAQEGLGEATFAQFYQLTGAELTIVAADMDTGSMLMLNHRTAPELPVAWAARMSSSVPFAFRNVRWREAWGDYMGQSMAGHRIIDGGVASNLPIMLMLADTDAMVEAMGVAPDRRRVLGFLLDEYAEVPGLAALQQQPEQEQDPISKNWHQALNSAHRLVETLMKAQDNFLISLFPGLVCNLPVQGFSSLQYDMSEAEVDRLVDVAQRNTSACLDGMDQAVLAAATAVSMPAPQPVATDTVP